MNRSLRDVEGIEVPNIPFKLEWVGDLLFFNWALISVFKDDQRNIYIKSWLEESKDTARYTFFKVDQYLLLGYINGDIPFVDVLLNPIDNLHFITDVNSIEREQKTYVLSGSLLHSDYIPKVKSYFDDEDSNDIDTIISTFGLNELLTTEESPFDIVQEAKNSKSDLINIHLSSKNGVVGYGKIQSHVLGEALVNYHKVAEATVITLYNQNQRTSTLNKNSKINSEEIKKLAITDYAYSKAASFSAFLKPVKVTKDENGVTSIEKIQSVIFNLFKVGDDIIELEKHPEFSQNMLSAFSSFLKVVTDNDVNLTIQYGNPEKDYALSDHFNKEKSARIINNLSISFTSEPVIKTYIGSYDAVSKRRKSFEFVTDKDDAFEGKFASELYPFIHTYRLDLRYKVTISTQNESISGKRNSVKKHTILVSDPISD